MTDLDELERLARFLDGYHDDRARSRESESELHELAHLFLSRDVPDLIAAARERDRLREEIQLLSRYVEPLRQLADDLHGGDPVSSGRSGLVRGVSHALFRAANPEISASLDQFAARVRSGEVEP